MLGLICWRIPRKSTSSWPRIALLTGLRDATICLLSDSGRTGGRPFRFSTVWSLAMTTTSRAPGPPCFFDSSRKSRWPGWRMSKTPVARTVLPGAIIRLDRNGQLSRIKKACCSLTYSEAPVRVSLCLVLQHLNFLRRPGLGRLLLRSYRHGRKPCDDGICAGFISLLCAMQKKLVQRLVVIKHHPSRFCSQNNGRRSASPAAGLFMPGDFKPTVGAPDVFLPPRNEYGLPDS